MKNNNEIECEGCGVESHIVFVHINEDGIFKCPNCKTETKILTEEK